MKDKKKLKLAVEEPSLPPQAASPVEAPQQPAASGMRDRAVVEQEYNNILFDIGGKQFAISRTLQLIKDQEAKGNALLIEIQMIDLQANLRAAHNKPQEAK